MSLVLYTWTTPSGRKISIMLEELGLPYELRTIDIGRDQQFAPDFLEISPNDEIPALVDDAAEGGPLAAFESGAILTWLAERTGRFLAPSGAARYAAMEWLHWSIGGLGPMVGQLGFFALRSDDTSRPTVDRFTREADRLLRVMDKRLSESLPRRKRLHDRRHRRLSVDLLRDHPPRRCPGRESRFEACHRGARAELEERPRRAVT